MKVPSIRVDGIREPICKRCIALANSIREAKGEPTIKILSDAYEPAEENEMIWGE